MPHIEISEEALLYLQKRAVPLVDTTISVVDKIINEIRNGSPATNTNIENVLVYTSENLPSVAFTSIVSADIEGKPVQQKKNWNNILELVIQCCANAGHSTDEIMEQMSAQTKQGKHTVNGYRPVPDAGLSFQGLDADRVLNQIKLLSLAFGIPVEIEWRWQNNEKAEYPEQKAKVTFP